MSAIIKLLIFAAIGVLLLWAGVFVYKKINRRILNSNSGWQIAGNGLLLFLVLALLFSGGIYLLITVYGLLKQNPGTEASAVA